MAVRASGEGATGLSRRDALAWLGTAGLATLAAACRPNASSNQTAAATTVTPTSATTAPAATTATSATTGGGGATQTPVATAACVLTPEQTEGPYYLAGEAIRTDITEGTAGTPLRLAFVVANVNKCAIVANASIDIWHADASGNYSGFNSSSSNRTFLRGIQVTDASGTAGFQTIYPGWYQGRATHIHVKVHVGGAVVHTGQLFFDETDNAAVYATSPYSAHTGARTLNTQDSIYGSGGAQSMVALTREGNGYLGAITLGIQA